MMALAAAGALTAGVLGVRGGARSTGHGAPAPAGDAVPAPTAPAAAAEAAVAAVAAVGPPAAVCGPEYLATGDGRCLPLNGKSGQAYSDEELERFDVMRATPYVAENNYFVPKVLTAAEAASRRALFQRMNHLADLISRREASAEQLDEYFQFRARLTHYRMQILSYQYVLSGGKLSPHDPSVDPEELTDPDLRARYLALDAEAKTDFHQLTVARRAQGLPAQEYLSPPEDPSAPPPLP
jgi:hypothetical protein